MLNRLVSGATGMKADGYHSHADQAGPGHGYSIVLCVWYMHVCVRVVTGVMAHATWALARRAAGHSPASGA